MTPGNPVSARRHRADAFWTSVGDILDESAAAIEDARQAVADAEETAAPCDHETWYIVAARESGGMYRYDAELTVVLACADCGATRTHRFLAGGNDTDDR